MNLRGVIFDLDGTLVDSQLDFDAIRADLNLSPGKLILEALDELPAGVHKEECLNILHRHEMLGAERAVLMPGVDEFLGDLAARNIATGILTRNSRIATTAVLERLSLEFSQVKTRNEVPPKPDPTGLLEICIAWDVSVDEVLFFGDYLFDIQAGHNAGIRTVLFAPDGLPEYAHQADFTIQDFTEASPLIAGMIE
jgi:HAD superfamily hydrolase (TIGR01509 family)